MANPVWMEEGSVAKPGDSERRSLQKWNSILYDALGDKGPSYYPEGSRPLASDNPHRSLEKINALKQ